MADERRNAVRDLVADIIDGKAAVDPLVKGDDDLLLHAGASLGYAAGLSTDGLLALHNVIRAAYSLGARHATEQWTLALGKDEAERVYAQRDQ